MLTDANGKVVLIFEIERSVYHSLYWGSNMCYPSIRCTQRMITALVPN